MNPVLSQEELDALRGELGRSDDRREGAVSADEPRPYGLLREDRAVADRYPGLESVCDRFAHGVRRTLAHRLGGCVDVMLERADVLPRRLFRNRVEPGSYVRVVSLEPLGGGALVVFGPAFVSGVIGRVGRSSSRRPTSTTNAATAPVERAVLGRLVEELLPAFESAWAPVAALRCVVREEEESGMRPALPEGGDPVLVLGLRCDLGAGPSRLALAVAASMLDRLWADAPVASDTLAGPGATWSRTLSALLQDTEVELRAEVGAKIVPASELLELGVGDVVSFPAASEEQVSIFVEGHRRLSGVGGTSRGQRAVRVGSRLLEN